MQLEAFLTSDRIWERRRAEEDGTNYRSIRRGWSLGREEFRKELLVGASHYGSERHETSVHKAERFVTGDMQKQVTEPVPIVTTPASFPGRQIGVEAAAGVG